MSSLEDTVGQTSRCRWALAAAELMTYHDLEWGLPVSDDQRLFEKLCLESFQSGLSWRTILNKRTSFRNAFCRFNIRRVAEFTHDDVARLLADSSIVRNRAKIEAVIHNAGRARELVAQEGSLAAFVWAFEPSAEELGSPQTLTTSPASEALAKALKSRGWKFLGPTTIFAFMQSMGLINDHAWDCAWRPATDQARLNFTRP